MEKLDLLKLHKDEYAAPKQPAIVNVKPGKYLAISGEGRPGDETFGAQVAALYGLAYTIRFARKREGRGDFKVCPLEGIYRALDGTGQDALHTSWKLLIRMPPDTTVSELRSAVEAVRKRGRTGPFGSVALEKLAGGKCVQMLHIGPYNTEHETVARIQEFAAKQGLALSGGHHEIYISDPTRVAPEKLKTILRYPVRS